jgi:hypothetical protein
MAIENSIEEKAYRDLKKDPENLIRVYQILKEHRTNLKFDHIGTIQAEYYREIGGKEAQFYVDILELLVKSLDELKCQN